MYQSLEKMGLDPDYIQRSYNDGERCLVKGRTIYQVCYSQNAGWYAIKLWCKAPGGVPLVNRGHYIMTTAKHANALAGFELLREDK